MFLSQPGGYVSFLSRSPSVSLIPRFSHSSRWTSSSLFPLQPMGFRFRNSACRALVSMNDFFWSTLSSWNKSVAFCSFLLTMLSMMPQAESDVLRKRSTAAPWSIIPFQYSSFKPFSRLSPSSGSVSLSHKVVARTTFFALLGPVSFSNMWIFRWGVAAIRNSEIRCTYTIPDNNTCFFLYLRRCGYQDGPGSKGLTRQRTFSLAIRQSA